MKQATLDWDNIWETAMNEWQLTATKSFYETCLKKTFILEKERKTDHFRVVLGIDHEWLVEQIKRREFDQQFAETLTRLVGTKTVIELVVASRPDLTDYTKESPLFAQAEEQPLNETLFHLELKKYRLEVDRSLENYAVSSSNEMAYAAAKAVAQRPGSAYNPLFLYGGVGVGKTHLMQGIGQELLKQDLNTKIIYGSGEDFTNAIIEAIRKKNTSNFRSKYRNVRLLLIDDIQFIAGKNSVQEEFFHTFNAVTASGGQIIMTSDKQPKEIDSLEDRLRSRFEGGLTIDIGEPNFELRCAILMIKAEQLKIAIDSEVIQLIAQHEEDTRALVGKLVTISTMARDNQEVLTLDFAQRLLNKLPSVSKKVEPPTFDKVVNCVSEYFKQPVSAILGVSRVKQLTLPRHISMYLLKEDLFLNYKDIGSKFSDRDHTSVMHAVRKVSSLLKKDPQIKQDLHQLRTNLNLPSGKL